MDANEGSNNTHTVYQASPEGLSVHGASRGEIKGRKESARCRWPFVDKREITSRWCIRHATRSLPFCLSLSFRRFASTAMWFTLALRGGGICYFFCVIFSPLESSEICKIGKISINMLREQH